MSKNEIGAEGAIAIAQALKTNNALEELIIGFCQIGDDGIKAFSEAVKDNTSLMKAFFGQNGVTTKDVTAATLSKIRDNKYRKDNGGRSRAEMAALDEL